MDTLIKNYIDGQLIDSKNGEILDNINPATGLVFGSLPKSQEADIELAYQSAKSAFEGWSTMSAPQRSKYLNAIADKIEERLEEFALAESLDNGKPISLARIMDIPRAVDNFRFFATAILHENQEAFHTDQTTFNYTIETPIGVVGCISPWNLPLYLFSWKIAPALASGCTVIAKPSEVTPLTTFLLSQVCMEVGLPKGVLNIVHGLGPEVGQAIIEHPNIKAISFTGGTKTGAEIARIAAPKFKKLSLELGGKNPNIIFDDCDFDKMMTTTLLSSFRNQGQICLCGSRILVQEGIYDKFKTEFVKKVAQLVVGNPLDAKTDIGAIVSKPHYEKILYYINLAKEEGGNILFGGNAVKLEGENASGYYIQPTIIEGLDYDCRTNQEEIFGPVVTIMPFKDEAEAIQLANSTEYGLASTIWTSNLGTAHRVAHKIESGIVWVNCWLVRDLRTPFGGMKQSGVGREGGFHALHFFRETKNICVRL